MKNLLIAALIVMGSTSAWANGAATLEAGAAVSQEAQRALRLYNTNPAAFESIVGANSSIALALSQAALSGAAALGAEMNKQLVSLNEAKFRQLMDAAYRTGDISNGVNVNVASAQFSDASVKNAAVADAAMGTTVMVSGNRELSDTIVRVNNRIAAITKGEVPAAFDGRGCTDVSEGALKGIGDAQRDAINTWASDTEKRLENPLVDTTPEALGQLVEGYKVIKPSLSFQLRAKVVSETLGDVCNVTDKVAAAIIKAGNITPVLN